MHHAIVAVVDIGLVQLSSSQTHDLITRSGLWDSLAEKERFSGGGRYWSEDRDGVVL